MKKVFLVVLVAAVGAGAWLVFGSRSRGDGARRYVTASVARGSLSATVAATGVVEAQTVVEIKSRASGQVRRIDYEEGDEVKQGDLLLELDGTEENRNLQVATASLRVAEAEEARARALLANFRIELGLDLLSEEAKVAAAHSQMERARNALRLFEKEHPGNLAALGNQLAATRAEANAAGKAFERAKEQMRKEIVSAQQLDSAHVAFELKKAALDKAKIDLGQTTSSYALRVADRKHEIAQLEAARRGAEASRDRRRDTFDKNLATRAADLAQARSRVATAQVEVARARDRIEFTKIYAEMDGVLVTRKVEKGQVISSGVSSVSGGDALAVLADLDTLYVTADVDESDIGKVEAGQRATITVDTFPDMKFTGRVMRIAPKGVEENNVVIFKVKILVFSFRRRMLRAFLRNAGGKGKDLEWARRLGVAPDQRKGLEGAFADYVSRLRSLRGRSPTGAPGPRQRAEIREGYVRARRALETALRKIMKPEQYALYNRRFLRIGMSANVEIEIGKARGALLVPSQAIRTVGGKRGIYVLEEGKPVFKRIGKVRLETGERTAVALEGTEVAEGAGSWCGA